MPEKNRFPAVLQPKPVVIDRAAFNQGQNAQYDPHIEETEVMDSLVARGPHAVGQPLPIAFKVRGGGNYSGTKGGEVKPDEKGGTGYLGYEDKTFTVATTQDQWVAAPIPYRKSKRAQSTTDDESWVPADASNTLNNFDLGDTRTTHAVVEPKIYENHAQDSRVNGPLDVAPTVAAKYGTGGGNVPLVGAMAVRRLTPVECERLQGFPDNWSRIPWKGKPEEDCPDGPRYKACGNSMAVPVMRWIGERIAAADAKYFPHA
jgi:site-specific DNA-cytosine methylase